jgi:hypothetical protein
MTKNEENAPPKAHCAVQEDEGALPSSHRGRRRRHEDTKTKRKGEEAVHTLVSTYL